MYVYIQSLNFLLLRDSNDYASMTASCNLWRSRIVRVYQIWESSTHYMLLKFQITKVISLQHLQPSSYSRACSTMLTNTQFVYSLSILIKKHITYCQNIHCFAFWGSLWLRLRFIGFLLSLFGHASHSPTSACISPWMRKVCTLPGNWNAYQRIKSYTPSLSLCVSLGNLLI